MAAAALALAGCTHTVNDYLSEARSNAPGAVKDAVIAIGDLLRRKEMAGLPFSEGDREAIAYLKEVAVSNPVPFSRAVAIRALGQLNGAEATDVIRAGLKDPFWLARLEAVQAIELHPHPDFAEPLRTLYANEPRAEVRLEIVKALRQIKGPVALRTLLEVFLRRNERSRDPQVHAFTGIREMSGLAHGFDELKRWTEYYQEQYGPLPGDQPLLPDPAPEGPPASPFSEGDRKAPAGEKGASR